jgi:peptidoglycan/xylan/chitin deacetylase (PgdA/CDA1 family)
MVAYKTVRLTLTCLTSLLLAVGGPALPKAVAADAASASCPAGRLYLTLDTGTMAAADHIAEVLRAEHIQATFFLANELTYRGDHALDERWATYWRDRVAEGHVFGSHTWSHASIREELPDGRVRGTLPDGRSVQLDEAQFCDELKQVDVRFEQLTGRHVSGLWRAPGGHTTPRTLAWAARCGFSRHVDWSASGFLGDELPADRYSNMQLLTRALGAARDGDILMMHLGIRSRRPPFAAVFRPLIAGLKGKGFCFATLAP